VERWREEDGACIATGRRRVVGRVPEHEPSSDVLSLRSTCPTTFTPAWHTSDVSNKS
jgi:hypothetical protein